MSDMNTDNISEEKIDKVPMDFVRTIIAEDIASDKHAGRVVTRFPPEPNGYLHIGHAKAFCLNFAVAAENNGQCNLRFDDTNPCKEETEYVDAIQEDIRWMGFDWGNNLFYASDYFPQMYDYAVELIKKGKAFVCDLNADQIREYRGTLTEPGKNSPYRDRTVEENLKLFEMMRDGKFDDGACVLRAKIDMSSGNINLRDPVMYRILKSEHHRQGSKWCIYPTYDWAHGLEDSIEGITHSLCSLEFAEHRPLYDWYLDELGVYHPRQYEFARLNINYTVMSKRNLRTLVEKNIVSGWDDPRMPTICGLRRRGFTPESIRTFIDQIGVAKTQSIVDVAMLEHFVRQDLNERCPRVMGVLRPLKMVIENFPEGITEMMEAQNHPKNPEMGTREVPFTRELYIERDDFMEVAPNKKFKRLVTGREIRLRYAYLVTCREAVKDENGEIVELRCTYDPATRGGTAPDGRKVAGTIHWVSALHSVSAEVRLYDRLFKEELPESGDRNFLDCINAESCEIIKNCRVEPGLKENPPESRFQFERQGYFVIDRNSQPGQLVFNRTITLVDTWAKIQNKIADE